MTAIGIATVVSTIQPSKRHDVLGGRDWTVGIDTSSSAAYSRGRGGAATAVTVALVHSYGGVAGQTSTVVAGAKQWMKQPRSFTYSDSRR